jgi:hypothetical protein
MNGSLQLGDYLGDLERLSCEKWGRASQYRKNQNPIERNACAFGIAEKGQ